MQKITFSLIFMLFFTAVYAADKPIFNIIDNECIVFLQGNTINSNINAPLEIFLNTITKANLQIWYIKKDQYSRVKFNNNTYAELASFNQESSDILLYKKGRSYYKIDLLDNTLAEKVNTYYGRKIYPIFDKRTKTMYAKGYEGVIYIKYNEKEIYDLKNGYLDEEEQEVYFQTQETVRRQVISNLHTLKIDYQEAEYNIKEIMFPNGYKISLDGKGGNLILFRQGKEPEVVPLSSQSIVSLNRFFKR